MRADDLSGMRRDYERGPFQESDLAPTWLEQFHDWLIEAAEIQREPNAMVLASADADGRPSARTVLLKRVDESGFTFYTNLGSRKGRELAANQRASLVFPWVDSERQVVVVGTAATVDEAQADEYFASRPYRSSIGAWASQQSSVLPDRAALERAWAEAERRFPASGAVPRPPGWGGFCVAPETVEFWQGRRDRLHDRLRYRDTGAGGWVIERLAP